MRRKIDIESINENASALGVTTFHKFDKYLFVLHNNNDCER
jgi:hypothetical protein